jgi:multicomponent Na+:H+ antiporter subunit F
VSPVFVGLAAFIAVLMAVNFVVVAKGPTIFDRLLGTGAMATNAMLLLVLIGYIYDRPDAYLDLAVTYAILNFIGVVAVAKYQERGGPGPERGRGKAKAGGESPENGSPGPSDGGGL